MENLYSFFKNFNSLEIFQIFINYFTIGYQQIFFIAIIEKFTICHLFLPFELLSFLDLFYPNRFLIIVLITSTIEIFFILVFLEIIELKFCGLNKYIKKNIEKRALDDVQESKEEKNNIIEISKGYLVDYDNQISEEELLGEKERKKKI